MGRIYFKVHGTVQGVNFRNFTQKKANAYGLKGWVRNTADEKSAQEQRIDLLTQVEGEAQGGDNDIQKLLKDLDEGPKLAQVVRLDHDAIEEKSGESGFEIK